MALGGFLRNLPYFFITLLVATTLMFFIVHNIPGDVTYVLADQIREEMGVTYEEALEIAYVMYLGFRPEEPLYKQYVDYLLNLLRGNLGYAYSFRMPVNDIVIQALPWTLLVLSLALVISFAIGVVLGLLIAWRRGGVLGPVVTAYAAFTDAMPDFITAMLLYIFLAVRLGLFPLKGAYDPDIVPGFHPAFILSVLHHAALPICAYVVEHIGLWALMMKGSATSTLEEDFVRAAVARGLPERRIMMSYVGRNAILPLVATLAIQLGTMLGGSTLVERVFSYPGIGYFFAEALMRRDYGLMQGLFFLIIAGIIGANLIVELIYPILDPRVRRETR